MRMAIAPLADGTTEVDVKLLPDGRTLIHWLQECDDGPIRLKGHPQLRQVMGRTADGRYRVACRPTQNTVNSQKRGNVRFVCTTSGDVGAVTCPRCLATSAAVAALVPPSPEEAAKAAQLFANAVKAIGV